MNLKYYSIEEAFPFIKQLLQDAYKVDIHYFKYPYEDTSIIDRGFRKMLWGKTQIPNIFTDYIHDAYEYQMAVTKSSLGYFNILAAVSIKNTPPDFITIGPFSNQKITNAFVHRIITNEHLSIEQTQLVRKFYEILPIADVNDVTIMVQHLLTAFIPEYTDIKTTYINYSESRHIITPDDAAFDDFSSASANLYVQYLNDFLDAIITGDTTLTNKKLKVYIDAVGIENTTSISQHKKEIYEINSFCKYRMFNTNVHPYYVLRLADSFERQIERCTSRKELSEFPYQFIRKYCLLIKNYSMPEYSYLIRNIINYIDMHIEEELSLSVIAGYFDKNASNLSTQFHKETGVCITDYINSTRIKKSLVLFCNTDYSIEDIAAYVGMYNSRYYSRLFKKYIGMTPSEYKRMIKLTN